MRIGIFGGSFNPVHQGHIRLAQEALSELNMDKIYFVPSCQNPLKEKEDLLPGAVRVRILKAALRRYPDFLISLCEIQRQGPSFTVDTLKFFKKKFGKNAALYFLSGADILAGIERWKSVDELFKLCHFVVMTRPGHPFKKSKRPFMYVPFAALDVSSSEVRQRLERGQSIQSLVPLGTETLLKHIYDKRKGGLKLNRFEK